MVSNFAKTDHGQDLRVRWVAQAMKARHGVKLREMLLRFIHPAMILQ
jgi:hypothetical protein